MWTPDVLQKVKGAIGIIICVIYRVPDYGED